MTQNDPFLRWFVPWKATRPEMTPIGWYTLADLEAAFNAGAAATDDRPGRPVSPPQGAGPVPQQD